MIQYKMRMIMSKLIMKALNLVYELYLLVDMFVSQKITIELLHSNKRICPEGIEMKHV